MDKHSYLSNVDSAWLDDLYQQYQKDPSSVETGWARFFEGFEFAKDLHDDNGGLSAVDPSTVSEGNERFEKEFRVRFRILKQAHRRGHVIRHGQGI